MDSDAYQARLAALIELRGYTFIGVFDPEGLNPSFAYSIGLTGRNWPEVLLVGNMNPEVIEIILTDLIEGWKKQGEVVMGDNPGLIVFRDGSEHALRVVEVDTDAVLKDYGCQVPNWFEREQIKFVQVLWPDTSGKYPDEPGYSADAKMQQPIIKSS